MDNKFKRIESVAFEFEKDEKRVNDNVQQRLDAEQKFLSEIMENEGFIPTEKEDYFLPTDDITEYVYDIASKLELEERDAVKLADEYYAELAEKGMSETDFILFVSDAAHKYLETHSSFYEAVFNHYVLKNGKFYIDANSGHSFPAVSNTLYITFKGENKHIRVIGAESEDNHTVSVLRDYIVSVIASVIMHLVNFEYGREEERSQASA